MNRVKIYDFTAGPCLLWLLAFHASSVRWRMFVCQNRITSQHHFVYFLIPTFLTSVELPLILSHRLSLTPATLSYHELKVT